MSSNIYIFPRHLNAGKFMWEVQRSIITVCLQDVSSVGDNCVITFKKTLSTSEYVILEQLVALHDPSPVEEEKALQATINEAPEYLHGQVDLTFRERSWELDIKASDTEVSREIRFPYPIVLLGGECAVSPSMVGDSCRMRWHLNPDEGDIVTALTAAAPSGDTHIEVESKAAAEIIFKGFTVGVMTADGPVVLGEVIGKAGPTLFLDSEITEPIPAGSYVFCYFDFIPHRYFPTSPYTVEISKDTHRGAGIFLGTSLEYTYFNLNKTEKVVSFSLGFYI